MVTFVKWLLVGLWFSTWFAAGYLGARAYYAEPKPTRHYEPLCMDPFLSRDMGAHQYNWCKLVPMWSTKA